MKKFFLLFALVLTVCSTMKAENLTTESAVGTVGTLDGREAMVVNLGEGIGKVAIATKNVGADVNDYGTLFTIAEANDLSKTGLTDGWYIPTDVEMGVVMNMDKLIFDDDGKRAEWKVTETSSLSFPLPGTFDYDGYGTIYTKKEYECDWKSYMPQLIEDEWEISEAYFTEDGEASKFLIRPFHKLPEHLNTLVPTTYIDADGVLHDIAADVVTDATDAPVTWGEAGKETWYVVAGTDVQLSKGAICQGTVNLILADGAKLTATGSGEIGNWENSTPGIEVSGGGNSLTIYGQTAQSGQLIANGGAKCAGIGGRENGDGSNITINGGVVTATGMYAAGIGGGYGGDGFGITINGGTLTAYGNGASGIGGGYEGSAYNIHVATSLGVKVGEKDFRLYRGSYTDLAAQLAGNFYVAIDSAFVPVLASVTYIDENGKEKTANAYEINKNTPAIAYLGSENTTTWYVVTGNDVQFTQGAVCEGNVHLILADGAKLTATGVEYDAGIQMSIIGKSLTIYGQSNQSGQLIANGAPGKSDTSIKAGSAGISGNHVGTVSDITINGGIITANGGVHCPGIGGSPYGYDGSNITINGGTVTANGGAEGAGIGGGYGGSGSNITINGGTVTANGADGADGIGSGYYGSASSNITVATIFVVKADGNNPPTTVIENTGADLAGSLAGKRYVTVTDAVCNLTANQDPDHIKNYYSTFYSGKKAYSVPEGVTAYIGAVDGDVLNLTSITDGIIPAGEAVILRLTTEEDNTTATKQQIALTATTTTATKSDNNALTGTDVAKTLGANDYALSLGQKGVGFYKWEGNPISAHKAYLTLDDSTINAKAFTFMFEDGTTTGIRETSPKSSPEGKDLMYDLNGIRVNGNYKGIVIKNGRKVYRK